MSYFSDESYDVYSETTRKARKHHQCCACGDHIGPNDAYTVCVTIFDGSAQTIKRCLRCQAIHKHLRVLCANEDRWPDERLNCGERYEDEWGDCPPEIQALAFMSHKDLQK